MPLINDQLFHEEWLANDHFRDSVFAFADRHSSGMPYWEYYDNPKRAKADRKSALETQAKLRDVLVNRQLQMHKQLRPWELTTRIFDNLDRNEPWWGFEFETGWVSVAARGEALAFTYDQLDGAMYDSEGEGNVQVEITFLPEERSKYMDGTSTAHKFMKWVDDHPNLVNNQGGNNVGTHLNMSHPSITSYEDADLLSRFLNRTLNHTVKVNGQRKEMFGREQLYAGFFAQFAGGNAWVEFKGYRTAYNMEAFNRYIRSADALQKCIDLFVENRELCRTRCVTNLYDVTFNGADPILVPWRGAPELPADGLSLHYRGNMGNI